MGHTRPHERQTESDVDRPMHAQEFHGYVTLIVIQRHHAVELPERRSQEERVGLQRPGGSQASGNERGNGRRDEPRLFVTEQAAFTT